MTSASSAPAAPRRTFWQRRLLDPVVAQLTQGITPEKIALTFAVGGACALFPILGATTLLCFLAALLLRLNQPIIHLINQLFWPLHIPVMYACIRLGERLFSAPPVSFNIARMNELFWAQPAQFFREYGATGLYAIAVWCLLAPFFVAAVYFTAAPLMRRLARLKKPAAQV